MCSRSSRFGRKFPITMQGRCEVASVSFKDGGDMGMMMWRRRLQWGDPYGMGGGGQQDTRPDKSNLTDAICAETDSAATKVFDRMEPDWMVDTYDPMTGMWKDPPMKKYFYCGFGGNAATSKNNCLGTCLNILKPAKQLECRKDVPLSGECAKGWEVKRDWRQSFGMFGAAKYCGPGYDLEWDWQWTWNNLTYPTGDQYWSPYLPLNSDGTPDYTKAGGIVNITADGSVKKEWPWEFEFFEGSDADPRCAWKGTNGWNMCEKSHTSQPHTYGREQSLVSPRPAHFFSG